MPCAERDAGLRYPPRRDFGCWRAAVQQRGQKAPTPEKCVPQRASACQFRETGARGVQRSPAAVLLVGTTAPSTPRVMRAGIPLAPRRAGLRCCVAGRMRARRSLRTLLTRSCRPLGTRRRCRAGRTLRLSGGGLGGALPAPAGCHFVLPQHPGSRPPGLVSVAPQRDVRARHAFLSHQRVQTGEACGGVQGVGRTARQVAPAGLIARAGLLCNRASSSRADGFVVALLLSSMACVVTCTSRPLSSLGHRNGRARARVGAA